MGEHVQRMLGDIMPAIYSGDRARLEAVSDLDEPVDTLHAAAVSYLGRISRGTLSEEQTATFMKLMEAVNNLESIGDVVERDLVGLGNKLIDEEVAISAVTRKVLTDIHAAVSRSVDAAIEAVSQSSGDAARAVTSMKDDINRLIDSAERHQAKHRRARRKRRNTSRPSSALNCSCKAEPDGYANGIPNHRDKIATWELGVAGFMASTPATTGISAGI